MNVSQSILSEITVFNKYAKFLPEFQRRENWTELCMRNKNMHLDKYPESGLGFEINRIYNDYVLTKKILPSMRSMQFGGRPIELSNNRLFNCFSRDTEFITSHGTKSFQDYEHGDQITVKTHLGNWKSATVKKYGKQNKWSACQKCGACPVNFDYFDCCSRFSGPKICLQHRCSRLFDRRPL